MVQIVFERLAHHATTQPSKTAVFEDDVFVSYEDLEAAVDRAAWAILDGGIQPGDVVGYFGRSGLDRIVALCASQKIGAGFVPLDPADPAPIHAAILRNAEMAGVITTAEFIERAQMISGTVVTLPAGAVARADVEYLEPIEVGGGALSLIKYTSGSTGLPKGVPSTRDAEAHFATLAVRKAELTSTDRVSLFGTYRTWAIYGALMAGATIGCFDVKAYGAAALGDWLEAHRISVLFCYPALFRELVGADRHFPALRHVQLVGEAVSRADIEAFERMSVPGAVLMNKYGSTEYPWIAEHSHRNGDPLTEESLPMGRPVEPGTVSLVTAEAALASVGQVGEIVLTTRHVPVGYHNDPERSAHVFCPGPDGTTSYRTGDLAIADEDGCLTSMGRKDDQIKIRGFTLCPSVIEHELACQPGVTGAAVVAVSYPERGDRLVCHYTGDASPRTLRSFLEEKFPQYMVPNLFLKHASLPRTRTGKIMRNELPNPFVTTK